MNCPVCNDVSDKLTLEKYKGESELFKNKNLLKCIYCTFVFMYPMPTISNLNKYYNNMSRTHEEAFQVYKIQAEERVKYLKSLGVFDGDINILDIGTGEGVLRDVLVESWDGDIDFFATELSNKLINELTRQNIYLLPYDDVGKLIVPNNVKFDIITICFVLEHQIDPVEFLYDLTKHLSPKGVLYIDVPHQDYVFKPIYEAHTLFFSKKSLVALANSLNLDIVNIECFGSDINGLAVDKDVKSLIRWFLPFFIRRTLYRVFTLFKNQNTSDRIKALYLQHDFDIVRENGRWIRCVLRNKGGE